MFLQYNENLAKIVLCSLNLNLPFNGKKRHYIWGWGQVSLHLFLSSFLFSLLQETIITPFCTSVLESWFCKINGTIDKIKKYTYLQWGKKTRQIRVGFVYGFNVDNISAIWWRSFFFYESNSTRWKPLTCRKSLTNFIT